MAGGIRIAVLDESIPQAADHCRVLIHFRTVDLQHWKYVSGSGGDEDSVAVLQILQAKIPFGDRQSRYFDLFQQNGASDAGQAAGSPQRGRRDLVSMNREDVGGSTLTYLAVFVEQNYLIESLPMRGFIPS